MPAVRFADQDADDQARIATPGGAIKAGADYLVMGSAFTKCKNRQEINLMCALLTDPYVRKGDHYE